MARPSYRLGGAIATIVTDPEAASRSVRERTPSVLVGADAGALGNYLSGAPDEEARERLVGVMVGEPESPEVVAAAQEMAGELWQWARCEGEQ